MMRFFQSARRGQRPRERDLAAGWGTDFYIGHVDLGQFGRVDELPSACFGAVFVRRSAFEAIGPLDSGYGSFYEDVDWSFRCWYGGMKIVAAPDAIVYHKFGGSYLNRPKLKFVVRNRQRLVLKLFQGQGPPGLFEALSEGGPQERPVPGQTPAMGSGRGLRGGVRLARSPGFPGLWLKRRAVMSRKKRGVRELDVFRRNFLFYCCLTPSGNPRIDSSTLLGYYRWIRRD